MKRFLLAFFALAIAVIAPAFTVIKGAAYAGPSELPMTQPLFVGALAASPTTSNQTGPILGGMISGQNNRTRMPFKGSVSKLRFNLSAAPGTGNSWTATLYKNGAPASPSLTCTISDAATSASDLVNVVTYNQGDDLEWQVAGSGSPAATQMSLSAISVSDAAKDSVVVFGNPGTTISQTLPTSFALNGPNAAGGSIMMPTSGTFDRLYATLDGSISNSLVVTLNVNGTPQGPTVTLTSGTGQTDNINSVHVNAGDIVYINATPSASLGLNRRFRGSLRFKPDVNGESFVIASGAVNNGAVRYYGLNRVSQFSTITSPTEALRMGVAPVPLVLKSLYTSSATLTQGSWTVRPYITSGVGTLVSTITTGNSAANDTAHQDNVNTGDWLYFQWTPSGSPNSGPTTSMVVYVAP